MVKIDLVTGFLGSGKTTFIRKYASYLIKKGCSIGILENDFGAVNVDMMLLGDLAGEKCELEMVAGGCDYDCHKRRFKTKLIAMGMCGYDRVLVEPSGIYDTDEFFDVLMEEPLDRWYEIGNVIVIVDAGLEKVLSEQSEYLLASQLAKAGVLIFSHTEGKSEAELEELLKRLNDILKKYQCCKVLTMDMVQLSAAGDNPLLKVKPPADRRRGQWMSTSCSATPRQERQGVLKWEDYEKIETCGYTNDYYKKYWYEDEQGFESLYYLNFEMGTEEVKSRIRKIMQDPFYGNIFRVKGFLKEGEIWMEMNATKKDLKVEAIPEGQKVLIIIGENLNRDALMELFGEGSNG